MTTPIACLVAYSLWAIVLVVGIATWRGVTMVRRERRINDFPSGAPHGSDRYWRLNRAHANAVENLPIFGVLVLATLAAGVPAERIATACVVVVGGRVVQSVVHIASNTEMAVRVRFSAFATQLGGCVAIALELVRGA